MKEKKFLIIGGTEKAGTTSVFQYLSRHPEVVPSRKKETDYFRSESPNSLNSYLSLFSSASVLNATYMEASPGYLAESKRAAPAIKSLIPKAKLLFILRDPIERLRSGFDFHKSRFHIPKEMGFDEYIDLCMQFERGEISLEDTGLKLWHLRVPQAGCYCAHLRDYFDLFPLDQIKVTSIEGLKASPLEYIESVCVWAGLDSEPYKNFNFLEANVTFSPRNRAFQRVGLVVNNSLEPFFNKYPLVKQYFLNIYKKLNGKRIERVKMSDATRELLTLYYREDLHELSNLLGDNGVMVNRWVEGYKTI